MSTELERSEKISFETLADVLEANEVSVKTSLTPPIELLFQLLIPKEDFMAQHEVSEAICTMFMTNDRLGGNDTLVYMSDFLHLIRDFRLFYYLTC